MMIHREQGESHFKPSTSSALTREMFTVTYPAAVVLIVNPRPGFEVLPNMLPKVV